MSAPYSELETPLSECSLVCRGCLANSGEMKDMYEWGLSDDFCKFAEVEPGDALSQLLCTSCENTLQACKQFRIHCQNSDLVLRKISMKKPNTNEVTLKNTITSILHDEKLIFIITAPDTEEKIYFTCPYHCVDRYTKKKDLYTHLNKNHHISKDFVIELQYYCPNADCQYHITSDRNKWFTERKFLNQHINKVHKSRVYRCETCEARFSILTDYDRHMKECTTIFLCPVCGGPFKNNERLLVHMLRKHPDAHKKYKEEKRIKRQSKTDTEGKRLKVESENYVVYSPKKSLATQVPEENIRNDVNFSPWQSKADFEIRTDDISTQTVFEDLLSLKSQNSEDDMYFSETVSLSDIQTQTFPIEFGLSRSNKETQSYSHTQTQSPDLSIKETQTCFCHFDSPRPNFRLFDSLSSSPASVSMTSTDTQTIDHKSSVKSDVLLGS